MAQIAHYDQGDVWTPQATFTVANVATDPTTLIVRVSDPSGVVTVTTQNSPGALTPSSSPIQRISAGVYRHAGIALNDAGYWFVRFEGTGTAAATEESQAIVDPSVFYESAQLGTTALVGLAETKDWLQQQNIDTSNDLDLARVINDLSDRFVQESGGREFKVFGTNPQTRLFEAPRGGGRDPWYVDWQYMGDRDSWRRTVKVGDLTSFTQVQIIDTDWTTVTETVALGNVVGLPLVRKPWEPITALQLNTNVTSLSEGMRLSVTGNWGFPAVPGTVRQAVLDAVATTMDRNVEQYRQDLGVPSGADAGGVVILAGTQSARILSLPPSSQAVAWSYRDVTLA